MDGNQLIMNWLCFTKTGWQLLIDTIKKQGTIRTENSFYCALRKVHSEQDMFFLLFFSCPVSSVQCPVSSVKCPDRVWGELNRRLCHLSLTHSLSDFWFWDILDTCDEKHARPTKRQRWRLIHLEKIREGLRILRYLENTLKWQP